MFVRLWRIFQRRVDAAAGHTRGAEGERLAALFLKRRGMNVVARNWRNPRDRREEIDLVCRDGEVLVFVEVKTRPDTARVRGYHAVDRRKRDALRRAIRGYLSLLRVRPHTVRFDVVEVVTRTPGPAEVLHFANVRLFRKWGGPG
jgi:putative endonuclease